MTSKNKQAAHEPRKNSVMNKSDKRVTDLSMSVEATYQILSLLAKEVVKIANNLDYTVDPRVIALASRYDVTRPTSETLAWLNNEIWPDQKGAAS